ncbi:MAG: T9SS type A sorting domain-containing protein [Bacteroidetes bacterium]|nr:T9SS type A sorting domain-containing protein [Bacteroidota bacterium]
MMKKNLLLFVMFVISLGSITAQTFVGKINPYPTSNAITKKQNQDLKILAVMVEFKADQDNTTFGDGTFGSIYTKDYGTSIIDPLPHDANYFADHLEFAKNYFAKVSAGKLNISYNVLNSVIKLPKTMREYSPNPQDNEDFLPLAKFAEEVWKLVDQNNPDINFADYDLFSIFHAGVGRDIENPGSIGNDRDLPSLYLSINTLTKALGENFTGFPVDGGQFKITNTMILPETESRELNSLSSSVLLELSINGLIAANIASHLGLPDLFDTSTGLSAIGRFGLMDGQSIFSFGGLFPPEPSPWEKMYLGWIEPVVIENNISKVNLFAKSIAGTSDTSLIKIPINSSEYFLIENRSRDALKDGCTIKYKVNGQVFTKTFAKDYQGFISYDVDSLQGVIIDVDEYDWAVPAFDRNDDDLKTFSDVGIVIWHIDENVIKEKILSNSINNNKFRRGVAVVEADGINDIGEQFQTIFGDVVIGEGSKEDSWYKSNPSELYKYYKNTFADNTKPSTKSNSGANSLIKISDFSEINSVMNFKFEFGSQTTKLLSGFILDSQLDYNWINSVGTGINRSFVFSNSKGILKTDGKGSARIYRTMDIAYKPVTFEFNGFQILLSTFDKNINLVKILDANSQVKKNTDSLVFTTSPVITSIGETVKFLLGNEEGYITEFELQKDFAKNINAVKIYNAFGGAVKQVASANDFIAAISENSYWDSFNSTILLPAPTVRVIVTQYKSDYYSVVLMDNNSFSIIKDGKIVKTVNLNSADQINNISLADLKSDGSNYIIINTGDKIEAFNLQGGRAEYFPIENSGDDSFVKTPLSLDINNDGNADVIAFTDDGKINVYSGLDGKNISPFPVSIGSDMMTESILFNESDKVGLVLLGKDAKVNFWQVAGNSAKLYWSEEFGNPFNNGYLSFASSSSLETEYFPKDKAYNWPNPVYDNITYFRFYVSEDSKVDINVFDLSGDLVNKISDNVVGGFDTEIPWNVSEIQSGVYFAHLSIKSVSGKSDYKIIKVAVIK